MRKAHLVIVLSLIVAVTLHQISSAHPQRKDSSMVSKKTITDILSKHTDFLMAIPGVIGTGEGRKNNKPCILVFVVKRTAQLAKKIPKNIERYPVVIEETGIVRPLSRKK